MLPKGVDPLFPNKRIVGYDAFGRPIYDMAATGLISVAHETFRGYIRLGPEAISDEQLQAYNQYMNERAKKNAK